MKSIPRTALLMSAYYFFFYGAIGCLLPYLPLYYQHIGLNGEQIGLLMGLGPIVLLVSGPLWGSIGDRFNLHRWLLPIASLGALLSLGLIPLTRDYTLLIAAILFQAFFGTAIGPLMDSAALEIAETTDTSFGQLRLGGTIGFTILSPAMGWLLTRIPLVWMFYSYMIWMSVAALIALSLPARRHRWNASLWQGFRVLLSQPPLAFFLAAAFLVGIAANAVLFFLPLYLTRIGGDSNTLGLAGAIAAITEIPIMVGGSRLIKRIGGVWAGVALGTVVYVVRWVALSLAVTPLAVMLVQALHGISFGLFIISAVAYVDSQAPPGLSATAQSLFIAAMWGVGAFTGSYGGGLVYENFGPVTLFQLCSAACFAALGLLFVSRSAAQYAMRRNTR